MGSTHIPDFVLVSAVFFAAGIVKGLLGMGLPTLAMGLLGLLMPLAHAAALITVPSLATNLWQAFTGGAWRFVWARTWRMQAGIVAGVAAASFMPVAPDGLARLLLGACLALYGFSGLAGWRLPRPASAWDRVLAPAMGAATGVITAFTGVFVLPAVPYLQSLQFDRQELVQALGLSFTTSTVALAGLLVARGQFGAGLSVQSALVLAPALVGMAVGQRLREGMSERHFRGWFFGGLVALGGWLVAG